MVLQHSNNTHSQERGFTIVELLIVIVVIGILAAITIVAYNGITNKANGSNARSAAESVQKVVEAYNADNGSYPNTVANLTSYNGSTRIPTSLTIVAPGTNCTTSSALNTCLSTANGGSGTTSTYIGTGSILYISNSTNTGACIGWYDYAGSASAAGKTSWIYAGSSSGTYTSGAWTNPTGTTTLTCA